MARMSAVTDVITQAALRLPTSVRKNESKKIAATSTPNAEVTDGGPNVYRFLRMTKRKAQTKSAVLSPQSRRPDVLLSARISNQEKRYFTVWRLDARQAAHARRKLVICCDRAAFAVFALADFSKLTHH
jgi:hypothetical protein